MKYETKTQVFLWVGGILMVPLASMFVHALVLEVGSAGWMAIGVVMSFIVGTFMFIHGLMR